MTRHKPGQVRIVNRMQSAPELNASTPAVLELNAHEILDTEPLSSLDELHEILGIDAPRGNRHQRRHPRTVAAIGGRDTRNIPHDHAASVLARHFYRDVAEHLIQAIIFAVVDAKAHRDTLANALLHALEALMGEALALAVTARHPSAPPPPPPPPQALALTTCTLTAAPPAPASPVAGVRRAFTLAA